MDLYDKFDYEMCGDEADEKVVMSEGARLAMVFSSGDLQGRGFKAKYTFETGNARSNIRYLGFIVLNLKNNASILNFNNLYFVIIILVLPYFTNQPVL